MSARSRSKAPALFAMGQSGMGDPFTPNCSRPIDQVADLGGLRDAGGCESQVAQTGALQPLGFFTLGRRVALIGIADVDRCNRAELLVAHDDVDAHARQRMIRMQLERVPEAGIAEDMMIWERRLYDEIAQLNVRR